MKTTTLNGYDRVNTYDYYVQCYHDPTLIISFQDYGMIRRRSRYIQGARGPPPPHTHTWFLTDKGSLLRSMHNNYLAAD